MMTFSESIKTCFKKYFDSEGRATRAEYWWFQLLWWCVIIFGITMMFATKGDTAGAFAIVWMLFFAFTVVPNYCVCVRRLHDTGWSARAFFWCLLGVWVGLIIINIRNIFPSDDDNEYVRNPFMLKKLKEAQLEHTSCIPVRIEENEISQDEDTRYMPHSTMAEDISKPAETAESTPTTTAMSADAINVASQEKEHTQMRYCRFCGEKVANKDAVYCKKCGKKL